MQSKHIWPIGAVIIGIGLAGGYFYRSRGQAWPEIPLDIGNGQVGALRLRVRGEELAGVFEIRDKATRREGALLWPGFGFRRVGHFAGNLAKIDFPLPLGEHPARGVFIKPTTFQVTGDFPPPLRGYSLGGTAPTKEQEGYFSLVVDGRTVAGRLPPLGKSLADLKQLPSAADRPKAPPRFRLRGTLRGPKGTSALQLPLESGHLPAKMHGLWAASFVAKTNDTARQVVFTVQPPTWPLQAGQKFDLGKVHGDSLTYSELGTETRNNRDWDSQSGVLKIEAIRGGEVTISLRDVNLKPRVGGPAKGSLVLQATGLMRAQD